MQVACANESLWRRLCAEFGFDPDAPGMATNGERVGNRDEVIALLERRLRRHPRRGPAGPAGRRPASRRARCARIDEVYGWDQTLSQGLLVDVEHATLGRLSLPGPPLRFFDARPDGETETTRREHTAPPVLGADGDAIRAWLSRSPGAAQPAADDVEDGHAT